MLIKPHILKFFEILVTCSPFNNISAINIILFIAFLLGVATINDQEIAEKKTSAETFFRSGGKVSRVFKSLFGDNYEKHT